jgi:gliding motility-associated-like protein
MKKRLSESRPTGLKPFLLFCLFLFSGIAAFAQPANDECANASSITIGGSGFSLGLVTGVQFDLTAASLQTGESFAPSIIVAGLNKKSIWYKFSIPTTRSVRISLLQPGSAIQAGNVGFAVYKTASCLPTNTSISTKLSPIETFGNTYHPCVEAGDYYIQVSGNNGANGPVYVTIELAEPSPALYDKPADASVLPAWGTAKTRSFSFEIGCQSLEDAVENCAPFSTFAGFTKSTWHTFTTPAYFDFLGVLLSEDYSVNNNGANYTVGYRIYEGNARQGYPGSLTQIGGCDSIKTNGYYAGYKVYRCNQLKPNTTYSIQLMFSTSFNKTMRLGFTYSGTRSANGPLPVIGLPTPNKIGVLPVSVNGLTTNVSDFFACNTRASEYNCVKTMPVNGIVVNSRRFNLSTFYSFTLNTATTLTVQTNTPCGESVYSRLYKQALTGDCKDLDTSNLIVQRIGNGLGVLTCLEPGDYVLQVMGMDSSISGSRPNYSNLLSAHIDAICIGGQLGSQINVVLTGKSVLPANQFGLASSGKYEKLNANGAGVMQPLVPLVKYVGVTDTLGCANTVLPVDTICYKPGSVYQYPKAVYREFVVVDSLALRVSNPNSNVSKLYRGDANLLATQQSAFSFPNRISGLVPVTKCIPANPPSHIACLTPGTYTLAQFDDRLGFGIKADITAFKIKTKYNQPSNPQDLGDAFALADASVTRGTIFSGVDTFSCHDNPLTIDGVVPCASNFSGMMNTKQHYRQFYVSEPATIRIYSNYVTFPYFKSFASRYSLFKGKVSEGVNTLKILGNKWRCFTDQFTSGCEYLEPGWYTLVSYGYGASYSQPLPSGTDNVHYSLAGEEDGFFMNISKPACKPPSFNRPHKASIDTLTKQPYKIEWGPQAGHTAAYPITGKSINLQTERFDCSQDTSFIKQFMKDCGTGRAKIAFYVFEVVKESYLQIDRIPNGLWSALYAFDVRTADSVKLKTEDPFQACINLEATMEYCKLQPGLYTLVYYAPNNYTCNNVTPSIYVDQVGYSRFDHARNAYDFGAIRPDSVWYKGKPGEVNPLNSSRAASNDFFYCTTGAQLKDPDQAACAVQYNPNIYNGGNNIVLNPSTKTNAGLIDRRNLWYTFTVKDPGFVKVRVSNLTPGKNDRTKHQYPYAVYKSGSDGNLTYDQVLANNTLDSTLIQGLSFVADNANGNFCLRRDEVNFYVEPCGFTPTRYFVLVENRNSAYYGYQHEMRPNSQVEVSVLLDSVKVSKPKFDHYSTAHDMGQINGGIKNGEVDNFTCATRDLTDPIENYPSCGKTLWYKFTTTQTGTIRYALFWKNSHDGSPASIQLFRQVLPGDSTKKGLSFQPLVSYFSNNGNWAEQCVSPGTYYLVLTGCGAVNEDGFPKVEIIPQAGDFCSAPMVGGINGAGTTIIPVKVDCHTIGTDYGEFNPTLTCPANANTSGYKTSWYRLDITGTDTLDVTVFINEKTNAGSADIKYRMMTGTCGAMQEQSCVQDALTRNTYKCLAPGNSYFIQVFSPLTVGGSRVVGTIDLNVSSVVHADTCVPANICIGVANFTPKFDCNVDRDVSFINFSTFGTSIQYDWDFGYNNQKSNAVSPKFFYPALTTAQNYTVKLVVTNTLCNKKDSITQVISMPARPSVNLGPDTVLCLNGSIVSLNATSHPGSTYRWFNGSTQPIITVGGGVGSAWVEVSYNNCKARDTISIWVNPIAKRALQVRALCNVDQVTLSSSRSQNELHKWSTGAITPSIVVSQPGYYWCDLYLNGCTVRDSFQVVSTNLRPLGSDTLICQRSGPYSLNATVNGASSYRWQDGSTNPILMVTKAGLYWCDIVLGGCTFRDSLRLEIDSFQIRSISARICQGESFSLPSGNTVSLGGIYRDSLKNIRGCDSIITQLTLMVDTVKRVSKSAFICAGQSYVLPSGTSVTGTGLYLDTLRNVRGCDSLITSLQLIQSSVRRDSLTARICAGTQYVLPSGVVVNSGGVYIDTIRARAGCDSIVTRVHVMVVTAIVNSFNASICAGKTYTLPSGVVVSLSGVYRDTIRNNIGCDSLISTVTLNVGEPIRRTSAASICAGQTYQLPSGLTVSLPGLYRDTARSTQGCDSLISLITLGIETPVARTVAANICAGQNYQLPSGTIVNSAGIYQDTLRSARGCDSLITTVQLAIASVKKDSLIARICAGTQFVLPSGVVVNTSGVYLDTIRARAGCDSIVTRVNLTVVTAVVNSFNASICAGKSYTLPSGNVVSLSGIYRDTLRNNIGCDSLISVVTLNVGEPIRRTSAASICAGQTYTLPSGLTVSLPGIYRDTARSTQGCDSLISLITLGIETPVVRSISTQICQGQFYQLPSGIMINAAGTYLDTLRSFRGCDSIRFIVTVSLANRVQTNRNVVICAGQTYTLPSGSTVTAAGVYSDTLRTVLGCDSIINTTLTVRPPLQVSLTSIPTICKGDSAIIQANVSGGNGGPYTYSWIGLTASGNRVSVSPASTTVYKLIVQDGCTTNPAVDSITIQVLPIPDAHFTFNPIKGCAPLQTQFNAALNNQSTTYQWSFGPGSTISQSTLKDPLLTFTSAGMIQVQLVAKNVEGCTAKRMDSIQVFEKPKANIQGPVQACVDQDVIWLGSSNLSNITAWSWKFGNGSTANVQNPSAIQYVIPGTYQIEMIARSSEGCSDTAKHTIVVQGRPIVGLQGETKKICRGASVQLTAQPGAASYQWSPITGLSDPTISNPIANPLVDTRYYLTVTSSAGCVSTDSVNVSVTQPFSWQVSADTIVCSGGSVKIRAVGADRYEWRTLSGVSMGTTAEIQVKPSSNTSYVVTGYGVDNCFSRSDTVFIRVIPLPTVEAGNDTTVLVGSSFVLAPAYGPSVVSYTWSPASFLHCANCPYPIATVRDETTYSIVVRDQYQCQSSDIRKVSLICNNESVFLPNTFTPNNDGVNDVFYPRGRGIRTVKFLRIYNRWGQLMFERLNFNTDDRSAGWNGTLNGKLLTADVYVYSLGMVCDSNQTIEVKGNIMLVR